MRLRKQKEGKADEEEGEPEVGARVVWVCSRRKGKQRRSRGRSGVRARVVWICFEYRTEGKGEMGGERRLRV